MNHQGRILSFLFSTFRLAGCGKTLSYRPMSGYTPDMPVAMAEARCKQAVSQQSQNAIDSAKEKDRANDSYRVQHKMTCSGYGASTSCSGSSYKDDSSKYAETGASMGELLILVLAPNQRMKECMTTYGFDAFEIAQ